MLQRLHDQQCSADDAIRCIVLRTIANRDKFHVVCEPAGAKWTLNNTQTKLKLLHRCTIKCLFTSLKLEIMHENIGNNIHTYLRLRGYPPTSIHIYKCFIPLGKKLSILWKHNSSPQQLFEYIQQKIISIYNYSIDSSHVFFIVRLFQLILIWTVIEFLNTIICCCVLFLF